MRTQRAYNNPPELKSKKPVNFSDCPLCEGSGWRYVILPNGGEGVTRCRCRSRMRAPVPIDYKSQAAGERG